MKYAKTLGLGLLAATLALAGCDKKPEPDKPSDKKGSDKKGNEHEHIKGPNGGTVFDLGKYHAEFTVDSGKKECLLVILGADQKTLTPAAGKDLTVTTKATKTKDGKAVPAMTIKLTAKDDKDGKATHYVGTDPGLANAAEYEGTVTGLIDGKPVQEEFKP